MALPVATLLKKLNHLEEQLLGTSEEWVISPDFQEVQETLRQLVSAADELPPEDQGVMRAQLARLSENLQGKINGLKDRQRTLQNSLEQTQKRLKGLKAYHRAKERHS